MTAGWHASHVLLSQRCNSRNQSYPKSTNTSHASKVCNQSKHFLRYFYSVDWHILWSWAHTVHCMNADCSLPLKVKAWGYHRPNLWSRATSALSYRVNVPWHCNDSVSAPIKEQFVAEAEDYTWLRCHSFIAAKTDPRGFQGQRCLSTLSPNKQNVRHWTEPWNVNLSFYRCVDALVTMLIHATVRAKERDGGKEDIVTVKKSEKNEDEAI